MIFVETPTYVLWFISTSIIVLQWGEGAPDNSEFAIQHFVRHGNVNVIQNRSTVTNPTMEPYSIFLPLTLPCRTTCKIANSLMIQHNHRNVTGRTKGEISWFSLAQSVRSRTMNLFNWLY